MEDYGLTVHFVILYNVRDVIFFQSFMRPQKSVRNSSFCNCIIFIFQEKGLRSTKPYKMMKQVAPLVAKTTLQLTRSDTKTDSRADEK